PLARPRQPHRVRRLGRAHRAPAPRPAEVSSRHHRLDRIPPGHPDHRRRRQRRPLVSSPTRLLTSRDDKEQAMHVFRSGMAVLMIAMLMLTTPIAFAAEPPAPAVTPLKLE